MIVSRVLGGTTGFGLFLASSLPVLAGLSGGKPTQNVGGFGDLGSSIQTIFNFVIVLAAVIFVILFLVGGVQYLTAAGNEEATGKAKRLLVDAIVGLVIVLAAWAVGNFILDQLGLKNVNLQGGASSGAGTSGTGGGSVVTPP